jgi:HEPN domain-containing protein
LPAEAFHEDLCFHAQQAAEKAIKAVYRHRGLAFRYTHDLAELIAGLMEYGLEVPPEVEEAQMLTTYAWEARYPGLGEPVTEEEYQLAVGFAEAVVRWAEDLIVDKLS